MVENRCYDPDCNEEECFNPEHYNYICFDPNCKDEKCTNEEHYNKQLLRDYQKSTDLSIFQAYGGGMSYIDMVNFKPEMMQTYNNIHIYQGKRHKTGVEFITVIFPKAIEILRKYKNNIPFISNQKLNEYAKEIQKASGITKNITSHLMRKTYASLLINHSVPIATISKMMGHSNTTITTKIYAHTQAETIANEVSNAFDIQNPNI